MEGVRTARLDDGPHIVGLARLARDELQPMRGGEMWARREARPEPLEAAYVELLDGRDSTVVVGTISDVIVGFGTAEVETSTDGSRVGVLRDLYVERDAREVGVGEAILDELVAFCADRGCVGVDAVALPGHRATKNFFETNGFTARLLVMHRPIDRS